MTLMVSRTVTAVPLSVSTEDAEKKYGDVDVVLPYLRKVQLDA